MLFFWLPGQKQHSTPKVNKLLYIEEIICTTGFNKLPGLPQSSQIWINIWRTGSIYLLKQSTLSMGVDDFKFTNDFLSAKCFINLRV